MKGTGWILILIAALGCVHSYESELRRVREGLIGLRGRDLRHCLPVPEVEVDGEREYLTYSWVPEEEVREIESIAAATSGRRRLEEEWPLTPEPHGQEIGYCKLVLSLRAGVVYDVRAEGRDHRGLNRSEDCLLEARRCLPEGR